MSNMIDQPGTQLQSQRPKRADARRNYDVLVGAARAVFTEDGTSAPLEDVAERAGLGIGTPYRRGMRFRSGCTSTSGSQRPSVR